MAASEASIEVRAVGEKEYVIVIPGEDHTTGSLLQTYLSRDPRVELAYYRAPHPLEEKIEVYVKLREGSLAEVLKDAIDSILETAREMRSLLLDAYREAGISVEED